MTGTVIFPGMKRLPAFSGDLSCTQEEIIMRAGDIIKTVLIMLSLQKGHHE
jgi:hypothetical protein